MINTQQIKNTIKTGMVGMVGLGALGSLGNVQGMPKNDIVGIASAGVSIANLGNLANIGMNIMPKSNKKYKW
jgi:hypothetical protein